uniref:Uncharacterized protein n=1 Tax=Glossina pallidipes TaxID=7398 RepID=A0A1A9Z7F2_GLOPL
MADKDMSRDHFIFRIFTRFALKSLATRLMAACRSRLRGLIMPDGPSLSMKKKRMPLMVTSFSKVNLGPFGSTIQRNSNAYGVGLWPQIPLNIAGNRDEPPMSDVKPNKEAPLASSAASPPDDPPGSELNLESNEQKLIQALTLTTILTLNHKSTSIANCNPNFSSGFDTNVSFNTKINSKFNWKYIPKIANWP